MTTLAQSLGEIKKPWKLIAIGAGTLLIWIFVASASLNRKGQDMQAMHSLPMSEVYTPTPVAGWRAGPMVQAQADAVNSEVAKAGATAFVAERKIIRTSSLEMVVQRPADTAEKITSIAEGMGGYLETASGGGQNATSGTLTIRVPAERLQEARTEIRKLGLRVERENVDAQDVTRQYVDQDARIRNLRAEEAQLLAILKQATTVKDMMAVSVTLSEVRGQIEQQQAEFNALSRQIETAAIAISLRTDSEAQVFGLNWRPGYQLKLALHDGLESIATYATAMTTILFYLPAALLWAGTILVGIFVAWRLTRWIGTRWFGSKTTTVSAQG
ncbi:MAG TPA: DUF4349 domain-containing protein [Candidatus Sulfotelmatobacter sp.]|nr:DUF4349 domain-containing protein [Candidatus Sulfotelmatobacter sp.]